MFPCGSDKEYRNYPDLLACALAVDATAARTAFLTHALGLPDSADDPTLVRAIHVLLFSEKVQCRHHSHILRVLNRLAGQLSHHAAAAAALPGEHFASLPSGSAVSAAKCIMRPDPALLSATVLVHIYPSTCSYYPPT